MNRDLRQLLIGLGLILGGGFLAWWVQTDGGEVRIREVRFVGANGIGQFGRLYTPRGVTNEHPAPGILAVHGYINSNETQSGFAIEFARRGYVVLAIDQTGHGYSDPPSGANGFGGPAALAFLRSLDIVDPDQIGMEGHSMGGWASSAAALAHPEGYRSIVLQGSSAGTAGANLRNAAVVFAQYDEFGQTMWGSPRSSEVAGAERLRTFFGTGEEPIEVGRIYGSIGAGSARVLYQPAVTHPGNHLSRSSIAHAIDWFDQTLRGARSIPSSDQRWYWKEFGTLLALVGMILLLVPLAGLLLRTPLFAELKGEPVAPVGATGGNWWVGAALFLLLPPLTLFPFKDFDFFGMGRPPASALFPQNLTTQLLVWAMGVTLISALLFLVWHLAVNRKRGGGLAPYGLAREGRMGLRRLGKSFLLALLVALGAYLTLLFSTAIFQSDYRFWVFGIKPMSPLQLRIAATYLPWFLLFFLATTLVLHGQLRREGVQGRRALALHLLLLVGGFAGFLIWQYASLFLTGMLATPGEPLWTIIAIQFIPIMTIVGVVSTGLFERTGELWSGAFLSALLVSWIVVASQATHFAF